MAFPIRFRGSHAIQRPPTQAASPYVFALSPYNHTPDASPHTSRQIPIGRPSLHTVSADPPYDPQAPKIRLQSRRDQRVRSPQIPNQPCLTNSLNLRYSPANQAPTNSSKSHMPAMGVAPAPPALTSSRPWSYLHGGYAYIFTAMASGHISDETSVRLERIKRQSNSLKSPGGHGYGIAWAMRRRRRRRRLRRLEGDLDPCYVIGTKVPIMVRPKGRTCSRAIGPEGPITVKPKGLMSDGLAASRPEGQPASSGLIVEPEGSTAGNCVCDCTCPQPVSQQTGTEDRIRPVSGQRQRRRRRGSLRINLQPGLAEICGDRTLVSSNAGSIAWPVLIRPGLVCFILACSGLAWFGLFWSGLILSDAWPVQLVRGLILAGRIAGCDGVNVGVSASTSTSSGACDGVARWSRRGLRRDGLRVSRLCDCVAGVRA